MPFSPYPPVFSSNKEKLQARILQLFYRHTDDKDLELSDKDFVMSLFERYKKYLAQEIVDVGE